MVRLRPLPWVPETFLARFPVSVKSIETHFSRGFVAHGFDLRPSTKIPAAREKNLWYTGYTFLNMSRIVPNEQTPFLSDEYSMLSANIRQSIHFL